MKNEIKEINIINKEGTLVATSREIATNFNKRHSDVLEKINKTKAKTNSTEKSAQYFIASKYVDTSGKENKEYLLTKDGFSLIVMGFTGSKALQFKMAYIDKFNEMENTLKEQSTKLTGVEPQVLQLAQGMQIIGQVVGSIQKTINNVQEFVKDSLNSKDIQIDRTAEMIGLRDKNTKMLSSTLKDKISELIGIRITATNQIYKNMKNRVFKEYNVFKWEDIPIGQYNKVYAYIDSIEKDDINFYV